MMTKFKTENLRVVVAGGSRGLGKCLAVELAKRGAHILLLARGKDALEVAKAEVASNRKSSTQVIDAIATDLCNHLAVKKTLSQYGAIPDIVLCVAGGSSPSQIGFLADLSPEGLISCLESNYYSAVFITQACLQLWIQNPEPDRTRHVIFVSSAAAFVGLPGYIAYTPPKAAIRAFADTLRQELLLYGGKDMYQVHSAFPGTFITDSFLAEQASKPEITKIMEGSNISDEEIQNKTPSALSIAKKILGGLDKGYFSITSDWESALILNNMRGPSPRDNVILDLLLALVAFLVWPFVRRDFDRKTRDYGRKNRAQLHPGRA
ncbi:related to 3-ketosphinganine reductase [Phialocephala subalpina]|uniref:Related to 3-ketosphinganine reductase n=1 Tax=Phialocephala subalpina TaxID=576137 RepID=A0A1L7XNU7_9HELO|nr:related to 3-ketosphinganine reductase [Phialocephala subalpina]